jgi:hypothetical protein
MSGVPPFSMRARNGTASVIGILPSVLTIKPDS